MTKKKRISIVGTVGLPAKYGGFETLVEHLSRSERFLDTDVVVYCDRTCNQSHSSWNKFRLKYLPFKANGWESVVYDFTSIVLGAIQSQVVLILGTSATFILPLARMLFPKCVFIVNIAGLEWSRAKWGRLARGFLLINEMVAVKYANILVVDNQGLLEYVKIKYNVNPKLITYGGDQYETVKLDENPEDPIKLPKEFDVAMARAQVDNNIETILDAYIGVCHNIVFISNWKSSKFGRSIASKYSKYNNIFLVGPFYDSKVVKYIFSRARIYVHGHSAGGTNPVLVESMFLDKAVVAFDVNFNRYTTNNLGLYFKSAQDLKEIIMQIDSDKINIVKTRLSEFTKANYRWSVIVEKYCKIML
jgi:glycosyltransferase involved in cell wall biosynthesis